MGAGERGESPPPPHTSAPLHTRDLARLRQVVYRLLGALFLYPDEQRLIQLVEVAEVLRAEDETFATFPFFGSWQRLLQLLTTGDRPETVQLEEKYVQLFVANPEGLPCLLYESFYLDPDRQAAGWIPAQLEQEYTAAGLTLSPSLNELPDHVSVELEYMAFLCGQEAEAWERAAMEEGIEILERERGFLKRHLGRWFPDFARNLVRSDSGGFYGTVARAAEAFILHDFDLLPLLLDNLCGVRQ